MKAFRIKVCSRTDKKTISYHVIALNPEAAVLTALNIAQPDFNGVDLQQLCAVDIELLKTLNKRAN